MESAASQAARLAKSIAQIGPGGNIRTRLPSCRNSDRDAVKDNSGGSGPHHSSSGCEREGQLLDHFGRRCPLGVCGFSSRLNDQLDHRAFPFVDPCFDKTGADDDIDPVWGQITPGSDNSLDGLIDCSRANRVNLYLPTFADGFGNGPGKQIRARPCRNLE